MHKVRVIPVLLLRDWGIEKTIGFRDPVYIGSPINAARVFNGLNVDELILLDVVAGERGRGPDLEVVAQITEEAFMPVTVGGGLVDVEGMRALLRAGADRVVINTAAVEDPPLVRRAADCFGSQCVVVSVDVRRRGDGSYEVFTRRGACATGLSPLAHALRMQELGAGELLLNAIDRDGTMTGYDLELVRQISDALTIPVIACGGAGSVRDLAAAVDEGHASAVAAGAFFLFFGARYTVLINYPDDFELLAELTAARVRVKRDNPIVAPPGSARG